MPKLINPRTGELKEIKEKNVAKALAYGYKRPSETGDLNKKLSLIPKGIIEGIGNIVDIPSLLPSVLKALSKSKKDQLSNLTTQQVEGLSGFLPAPTIKSEDSTKEYGKEAGKKILDATLHKLVDKNELNPTTFTDKLIYGLSSSLPFGALTKLKPVLGATVGEKTAEELTGSSSPLISIPAGLVGASIGNKFNPTRVKQSVKTTGKILGTGIAAATLPKALLPATISSPLTSLIYNPVTLVGGLPIYNVFSKRLQKHQGKIKNWMSRLSQSQTKIKELEKSIQQTLNLPDSEQKQHHLSKLLTLSNQQKDITDNLKKQINQTKEKIKDITHEFNNKKQSLNKQLSEIEGPKQNIPLAEISDDIKEAAKTSKKTFQETWANEYNKIKEEALKNKQIIDLPNTSQAVQETLKSALNSKDIDLLLQNPFIKELSKIKKFSSPASLSKAYSGLNETTTQHISAQLDKDNIKKVIEQAQNLTATPVQIKETLRTLNTRLKEKQNLLGTEEEGLLKNLRNILTQDIEATYSPSLKSISTDINKRYAEAVQKQKNPLNELLKVSTSESNLPAKKLFNQVEQGKDIFTFLPTLTDTQKEKISSVLKEKILESKDPSKINQHLKTLHPNVKNKLFSKEEENILKDVLENKTLLQEKFLTQKQEKLKNIEGLHHNIERLKESSPEKQIKLLSANLEDPINLEKQILSSNISLPKDTTENLLRSIQEWKQGKDSVLNLENLLKTVKKPTLNSWDNPKILGKLIKRLPKKIVKTGVGTITNLPTEIKNLLRNSWTLTPTQLTSD